MSEDEWKPQKSRLLARLLRHVPELWQLQLDENGGWCDIEDLLDGAKRNGFALTRQEIVEIVGAQGKQRFALSPDDRRIRALQGHSVAVELHLKVEVPPPQLFHGTTRHSLQSIRLQGLLPQTRHAVHLSSTRAGADAVGRRRGAPVVLVVDSAAMTRDGLVFHRSDNGVWLTAAVLPQYIRWP